MLSGSDGDDRFVGAPIPPGFPVRFLDEIEQSVRRVWLLAVDNALVGEIGLTLGFQELSDSQLADGLPNLAEHIDQPVDLGLI